MDSNIAPTEAQDRQNALDFVLRRIKEETANVTSLNQKFNRLRMPKTRNLSVRNKVTKQRNEIRLNILKIKDILQDLAKQKIMVESVPLPENDLDPEDIIEKLDKIDPEKVSRIMQLLEINCPRDDGWENDTYNKVIYEIKHREDRLRWDILIEILSAEMA